MVVVELTHHICHAHWESGHPHHWIESIHVHAHTTKVAVAEASHVLVEAEVLLLVGLHALLRDGVLIVCLSVVLLLAFAGLLLLLLGLLVL